MSTPEVETIERFYNAFSKRDGSAMEACYAPNARFTDPVFSLNGKKEVGGMWRMLCERGADLRIEYSGIEGASGVGSARWDAHYTFGATGRFVHNRINAKFVLGEDGLIAEHTDTFDFHAWARQALGPAGLLLGWTSFLQRKVQRTAGGQLERYLAKENSV